MLKWGSLPGFWHSQNLSSIIQAQIHLETAALLLTSSILNLFKANTPYQILLTISVQLLLVHNDSTWAHPLDTHTDSHCYNWYKLKGGQQYRSRISFIKTSYTIKSQFVVSNQAQMGCTAAMIS